MKLSTSQLKYVKSLHQRKFRQKYHNFIVEGVKIAAEVLQTAPDSIEGIYALPEWAEAYQTYLSGLHSKLHLASLVDLERISLLTTPNQVLLVMRTPQPPAALPDIRNSLSLYLDNIQDPGNLGAILRIADWFGIPWVFLSGNCVDPFSPKVIQAGMGAFLRVKTLEINILELTGAFPKTPVFGAMLEGENLFQASLPANALLVIGNESQGISPETMPVLTHKISIPRHPGGGAESLNAAVATGIFCAQFRAATR
jgi:TrmH family RNA methyltransferase